MKQLVDLGSPIGSLAGLSLGALRAMRSDAAAVSRQVLAGTGGPARRIRVALVGGAWADAMAGAGGLLSDLEVVGAYSGLQVTPDALHGAAADVVAMELPTLQADAVSVVDAWVQAANARRAIVAYRFGPAVVVRALRDRGYEVTRAPLAPEDLERLCREATESSAPEMSAATVPLPPDNIPAPRFDDESLNLVARSLTTLYCECPHHVVELLRNLGAFERYSAECANRGPADAVLHRYLERVAGSARVLFEDALIRVARAENLGLPVVARS